MNILAVDTSSENLSLALLAHEQLFTFERVVKSQQSEFIIPEITRLLQQAKIEISDLDVISYNQGPGSFTGLRIGLAVVLGIAYAQQISVIPIPGFYVHMRSILSSSQPQQDVIVAIDARLNQVYLAGIKADSYEYFIEPRLYNPAEIVIDALDCVCVGDGFTRYHAELPSNIQAKVATTSASYPCAKVMIDLIVEQRFKVVEIDKLGLLYIRDKIALNIKEQQQLRG